MDSAKLDKLKEYAYKNSNSVFALKNWIERNVKPFKTVEALECIYDFTNGSTKKMTDIITHLTAKQKHYGRTQVYTDRVSGDKMDIVKDNGQVKLINYEHQQELPLKGQKVDRNPKIFRKSDDQVSKTYQNTEDRLMDLGKLVRELYPNQNNDFIALAMQSIREYAAAKKLNVNKVVDGLKNKKLRMKFPQFKIIPVVQTEGKTFIIDENMAKMIVEELEMSEYKFYNYIKKFLHDLLVDPVNAKPCQQLSILGYTRYKLLYYMKNCGIIEKEEKINDTDENGELKPATMMVKYKVPKKNFERKLKKLYIKLFERNVPKTDKEVVSEEGECGGATGSDASGQYSQPLFGVQRRQLYDVEESTTTSTVGDYQYTVPFPGDKETLARKNGVGGSVSINNA